MRIRWRARWRFRRAAAALVALALLPVGFLVSASHAPGGPATSAVASGVHGDNLRAEDGGLPTADALQRSESSSLFAPFAWDGQLVSGPFVAFDYSLRTNTIVGYFAVNGTNMTLLVNTVAIGNFIPVSAPVVSGARFFALGDGVSLEVHDEPMGLLEIRNHGVAREVELRFPSETKDLAVIRSTSWPESSLAFAVGGNRGRLIVGRGNLSVNATTVTADLAPQDYLALRAVPAFTEHAAERSAVLEAFGSGRLAAEYDLVAMTGGGWLENSAEYEGGLAATSSQVSFSHAVVTLATSEPHGGLVILAFDPQTMPVDEHHVLLVSENGVDLPRSSDPVASLYGLPGTSSRSSFALLRMNATVVVVYVPDLNETSLQVESITLPVSGLDWPTELAMIAAAFVVSVAAAIMFRRPDL